MKKIDLAGTGTKYAGVKVCRENEKILWFELLFCGELSFIYKQANNDLDEGVIHFKAFDWYEFEEKKMYYPLVYRYLNNVFVGTELFCSLEKAKETSVKNS